MNDADLSTLHATARRLQRQIEHKDQQIHTIKEQLRVGRVDEGSDDSELERRFSSSVAAHAAQRQLLEAAIDAAAQRLSRCLLQCQKSAAMLKDNALRQCNLQLQAQIDHERRNHVATAGQLADALQQLDTVQQQSELNEKVAMEALKRLREQQEELTQCSAEAQKYAGAATQLTATRLESVKSQVAALRAQVAAERRRGVQLQREAELCRLQLDNCRPLATDLPASGRPDLSICVAMRPIFASPRRPHPSTSPSALHTLASTHSDNSSSLPAVRSPDADLKKQAAGVIEQILSRKMHEWRSSVTVTSD